ncbi:MAG: polysaccharide deacetylase family protein [Terriglobales bacterium]
MRASSNSNPQAFVTLSVDDGHPADLRVADLLAKYDLAATFYIPGRNPENPVMSVVQLRELSQRFELGGHTLNHLPLSSLSTERAWQEITEGKDWLENSLGKPVRSFCYPMGKFGNRTAALVRKAGFLGARTCQLNRHDFPQDPFAWGVSTQAHDHGKAVQVRHALLEQNFQGAFNFLWVHKLATDWETHFRHALDRVEAKGGIAHLYLHSWEIEQCGEWRKLESALRTISQRKGMSRVTNGELFAMRGARRFAATESLVSRPVIDSPASPKSGTADRTPPLI